MSARSVRAAGDEASISDQSIQISLHNSKEVLYLHSPNRVIHSHPPPPGPDLVAMSPPSESKLFSPLAVGKCQLRHRVVMAPLTRLRVDEKHVPMADLMSEYYVQRCCEPGTLIIAESNAIAPEHCGAPNFPGLWNDAQIEAWRKVVDAIHSKGCYVFAQVLALGRVADKRTLDAEGGWDVVSSSDTPFTEGPGSIPKPMTKEDIDSTIQSFAQAAKNAIAAGFDGVEVHGANGYLVDQFTQDNCNRRTDDYGGSVENRSRFAIEVAQALVDAIGHERVGFRISPFSTFQGMKMADPVPQFSHLTSKLAELKLAYLHIIESRVINSVDIEKTESIEPFMSLWKKTNPCAPILVAGGYTPENAKIAVDEECKGYEVGVVFGRHFISNPDLVFRIRHGVELNKYDRSTFYAPMQREGYLDYPFSGEWKAVVGEDGELRN